MSKTSNLLLFYLLWAASTGLIGCGKGFQAFEYKSDTFASSQCLSRSAKNVYNETGIQTFITGKVQLAKKYIVPHIEDAPSHKLAPSYFKLEENTPLAVMVNHNCVSDSPKDSYSRSIVAHSKVKAQTNIYAYPVTSSEELNYGALVEAAEEDPCVIGVGSNEEFKQDLTLAVDPKLNEQEEYLTPMNAKNAWSVTEHPALGANKEVIVAVIDSGVDYNHDDLKNNMWSKNGKYGHDFAFNDDDPMDDCGHGTMVSGFIGAEADNGVGIKGLFGTHVKIMAIKTMQPVDRDCRGSTTNITNGITWAVDNGADIINLSLGGKGNSPSIVNAAIDYALKKNVVLINAAGNSNLNISTTSFWPANNGNKPGFVVVGATTAPNQSRAYFSNYSKSLVHIMAPGHSATNSSGIYTTKMGNLYTRNKGTSFAAPIVAGAAALAVSLIKSRGDTYTPDYIESLIMDSAEKISELSSHAKDGNYLNVGALVNLTSDQASAVILEQPKDQHLLINEPLSLSVTLSGSGYKTYQWYKDGEPINGAISTTYKVPAAKTTTAGKYHVVITNDSGSSSVSNEALVAVYSTLCSL